MKKLATLLSVSGLAASLLVTPAQAQIQFEAGGFDNSVADIAISVNQDNGEFSTLIAALSRAGLVGILDSLGPLTVFAPTDEAFEAAGLNADNLDQVPVGTLRRILLNHVVLGTYPSGAVLATDRLTSLVGAGLRPRYTNSGLFIVDAKYAPARVLIVEELFDIRGDNGIIHVIDNVLTFQ